MMIKGLLINTNAFDAFLYEPFTRFSSKARRIKEILLTVAPVFVPSGVYDDDVVRLNFGCGILQVLSDDELPLFLGMSTKTPVPLYLSG
jgi:hypothetical protein